MVALQNRINQRVRERVQTVRDASDRISVSDLRRVEDEVLADFRDAFEARRQIFRLAISNGCRGCLWAGWTGRRGTNDPRALRLGANGEHLSRSYRHRVGSIALRLRWGWGDFDEMALDVDTLLFEGKTGTHRLEPLARRRVDQDHLRPTQIC